MGLIFWLSFVGVVLGILGFLYQMMVMNKLVKKEQPVDAKNKVNMRLLKQNLIGACLMLIGSLLILFALIFSYFPKWL